MGRWRGEGKGEYPTIDPFSYEEELTFDHVGDTFLRYQQASWSPVDGAPIHFERGFLRPGQAGRIEFTLAHPIGLTEVAEGALDGTSFELSSTDVGRTTTGLTTTVVIRRYQVDGDVMRLPHGHGDRRDVHVVAPRGRAPPGPPVSDEGAEHQRPHVPVAGGVGDRHHRGGIPGSSGSHDTAHVAGP